MTKARERGLLYLWCFAVAFLCLAVCSKNSFFYPLNDWVDAQSLFTAGKSMLHGNVLYRDIYEHKGPVIYALNALGALISGSTMIGVFLLEVCTFTLFLAAVARFLQLFDVHLAAFAVLPLIAAAIVASPSFMMGGSAEEFALPALAWSIYYLALWAKTREPMRMHIVLLNGALCGLVFWMKFTLVGLYIPWLLILLITYAARRQWKTVLKLLGFFALGFLIATLPWIVYFAAHHAMRPFLQVYLYDNIFVYGRSSATAGFSVMNVLRRCKAILTCGIDFAALNPAYAAPLLIGLAWMSVRRGASALERWMYWLLAGFAALGAFFNGTAYVYYGLVLAAFGGVMALPVGKLLALLVRQRRRLAAGLAAAALAAAVALCYFTSPSVVDILQPRQDSVQYRMAAIINQTPDATLLNYSAMDVGFYTACNIVPNVKYFHKPNVPLDEIMDEQNRYVAQGVTDYVVVQLVGQTPELFNAQYELITEDAGWSLYRLKSLGVN